jgi:molecular chaperone GrpE
MTQSDKEAANANDNGGEAPETDEAIQEGAAGHAPEEQVSQLKDQLLRALAENENARRRAQREVEDARKYAVANFARDVLTVADNLSRALAAVPEDAKGHEELSALIEGVSLTERELLAMMERHGIRKIEPKGEKFDHNLHQAMFEAEVAGVEPGTVIEVAQAGYVIGDRLLRPAMVGVAKKSAAATSGSAAPAGGDQVDTKA